MPDQTAVEVKAMARIPRLPNFIFYPTLNNAKIDVADMDDADLSAIGEAWKAALVAHAQERRKTQGAAKKARRERYLREKKAKEVEAHNASTGKKE